MYQVSMLTGDYRNRQMAASAAGADLYVEYHFNHYSRSSNYTLAKASPHISPLGLKFAQTHVALIHEMLGIPLYTGGTDRPASSAGVVLTKRTSRDNNQFTMLGKTPGVLLEPLFLSNPTHVELIDQYSTEGLAAILVTAVKLAFPTGANIAFSVGHKYVRSNPMDRGYPVPGRPEITEADLSDQVLRSAAFALTRDLPVDLLTLGAKLQ